LSDKSIITGRLIIGGSCGELPMHRQYYLGGLGSLHGYEHKEFSGENFWLSNIELRYHIGMMDMAAAILWDAGQTTDDKLLSDNSEVKNALGLALYLGSDLKLILAQRKDRSKADLKFYIRLSHFL